MLVLRFREDRDEGALGEGQGEHERDRDPHEGRHGDGGERREPGRAGAAGAERVADAGAD